MTKQELHHKRAVIMRKEEAREERRFTDQPRKRLHTIDQSKLWQKPSRGDKKRLKQEAAEAGQGAPFKGRVVNLSKGEAVPGKPAPIVERYRGRYIVIS